MENVAIKDDDMQEDILQLVRMQAGGHAFAIEVAHVCDVLQQMDISPIPLAPTDVVGALNLRGRVVTVIDLRIKLGLEVKNIAESKGLVIEQNGELYCLLVDKVLEVVDVPPDDIQSPPQHLSPQWLEVAKGVYPLGEALVVVLEIKLS